MIAYAARTGITVADGVAQVGQDLTLIPSNMTSTVTVDFGTPPSGLTQLLGLVGIEMGDGSGVIQLPITSTTVTSAPAPALANFSGAMYRLSAIAQDTATPPLQADHAAPPSPEQLARGRHVDRSAEQRERHAHDGELDAGGRRAYSTASSTTRARPACSASRASTARARRRIPDLVTVPSGSLTVKVQALTGTGIDLGDLSIDRDREKLAAVGVANVQLN